MAKSWQGGTYGSSFGGLFLDAVVEGEGVLDRELAETRAI